MRQPAPEVTLRPTLPDDVDELAALWHRGWCEAHQGRVPRAVLPYRRPADFRRRMAQHQDRTVTAVVASSLAGFVTVRGNELEQLYVDEPFRGRGIAPALLRAGERSIAAHFSNAWLAVVADNARARVFYGNHGWRDSGPITHRAPTVDGGTVVIPALRYEKSVDPATIPTTSSTEEDTP